MCRRGDPKKQREFARKLWIIEQKMRRDIAHYDERCEEELDESDRWRRDDLTRLSDIYELWRLWLYDQSRRYDPPPGSSSDG